MELYDITAKNFGPYVEFNMPLYKQGLVWVGGVNKDTAAADSNGSGKTSLFKALTWCLYGDTIDGDKGDRVIHKGARRTHVETRIMEGKGKYWTVRRIRTKGSPRLELVKPDGKQYKGSKDEIQAQVIQMVGLDFKAFKNTVLYGQNDSARFAHPKTKDSDRKDMLHRIMRTELLAHCHESVKAINRDIRKKMDGVQSEIDGYKVRIEENDLDNLKAISDGWETKQKSIIEDFRDEAKEHKEQAVKWLEKAKAEAAKECPDVAPLLKELGEWKEACEDAKKAQELAKKLMSKLEKMSHSHSLVEDELSDFKHRKRLLKKQLEELEGDNCPLCTAPLKEGAAHAHIARISREYTEVTKTFNVAVADDREMRKEMDELRSKYNEAVGGADTLPVVYSEISRVEQEIHDAENFIAEQERQTEAYRDKAKRAADQARNALKAAKKEAAKENPYEKQLDDAKSKVEGYLKKIKKLEGDLELKRVDLTHHEFWAKGFSNQGLPSFVLDSVMPYITERANYYLETLSDGDITMEFATQRELKSTKGEYRDEININWSIEGLEDSYPPSGGQLKKMEIAADLALMDLVATREGGHLDILMLDEVLDGLDSEGCSRIFLLLQNLRAHRGSIFVISHESEVAEAFEKSIMVVKESGSARLEA